MGICQLRHTERARATGSMGGIRARHGPQFGWPADEFDAVAVWPQLEAGDWETGVTCIEREGVPVLVGDPALTAPEWLDVEPAEVRGSPPLTS